MVPLDEVAAEVVAQNAAEAAEADVTVSLDSSPVTMLGDRALLERLVAQPGGETACHNHGGGRHGGGRVDVVLFPEGGAASGPAAGHPEGRVVLRVSNTGPVVPADTVDALFDPFRRLGVERTGGRGQGVGLGLSIVRSVAVAHGGAVSARAHTEGGLEVEVRLPAARSVPGDAGAP